SRYVYSARAESTFAPMGIFPPACSAAATLAMSMGADGLTVATSNAGWVCAKAAVAMRTARLDNVTVNLYIRVLFDFGRKATAVIVQRGVMKNLFDVQTEE